MAVNDLSLKVEIGQMVGVIGSNSAGKTTLMNTISGLILDQRLKERRKGGERITILGQVFFRDRDISEMTAFRRAEAGIAAALPGAPPGFPRTPRSRRTCSWPDICGPGLRSGKGWSGPLSCSPT